MQQLEEEILPAWEMNAEAVGEDLGGITGDLAIGPAMVRDMVARIKELEAQVATQNPETKAEVSTSRSQPTS